MADIAWSNVVDFAPELSGIDADAQTDILAYVNDELDVALFDGESGPKTKLARIYLAAHVATGTLTGSSGGAAGPVTAEAEGGLSRSYGSMSAALSDPAMLALTPYGLRFLGLVNTSAARGPLAV